MMKHQTEQAPFVIARKVRAYEGATTYAEQFDYIEKIYTQIWRYVSVICLSDYLQEKTPGNQAINIAINSLIRPSIGDWLEFLRVYAKQMRAHESGLYLEELPQILKELQKEKRDVLRYEGDLTTFRSLDLLSAILVFRNMLRHGSVTPDETLYKAYVEVYAPLLWEILEAFETLFERYKLVSFKGKESPFSPLCFDVYDGDREDGFGEWEVDEDELQEDFTGSEGDLFILSTDFRLLPLSELFKAHIDDEADQDYLLYDGLNKSNVKYVGMKKSYMMEQYMERLRAKFVEKKIPLKFGKGTFDLEGIRSYINDLTGVSVGIHERSGKYRPETYVKRYGDLQVDQFLASDKTGLVITADAGSGKTNLTCHVARSAIQNNDLVYLIRGDKLSNGRTQTPVFDEFKEEVINGQDFLSLGDFFKALDKQMGAGHRFILLIDAVNESYQAGDVLQEADAIISRLPYYEWLKVIVTVRSEFYRKLKHHYVERMGKKFLLFSDPVRYFTVQEELRKKREVTLAGWSILERKEAFDTYKSLYGIEADSFFDLPPSLWDLLALPLHMKLLFTVMAEQGSVAGIQNGEALFEAYHGYLMEEGEGLSRSAYELLMYTVDQMLTNEQSSLETSVLDTRNELIMKRERIRDVPGVLTPYERLVDAGILEERLVNSWYEVRFVYQAYAEFLLHRRLREEDVPLRERVGRYVDALDLATFPELQGAYHLFFNGERSSLDTVTGLLLEEAKKRKMPLHSVREPVVNLLEAALSDSEPASEDARLQCVIDRLSGDGVPDWLMDTAQSLFRANRYTEAKTLLTGLATFEERITKEDDLRRLFHTLALIHREQSGDLSSTASLFERALGYASDEERVIIRTDLVKLYRINGHLGEAEEAISRIRAEEDLTAMPLALIRTELQDQLIHRARGDYAASLMLAKANAERRGTIQDEAEQLNLKAEYAIELEMNGDVTTAIELGREVLQEAADLGEMPLLIDTMNALARRLITVGENDEAIYWAKEGLSLWTYSGFYRGQLSMCIHLLRACHKKGSSREDVRPYLEQSEALSRIVKEELILSRYREVRALWE